MKTHIGKFVVFDNDHSLQEQEPDFVETHSSKEIKEEGDNKAGAGQLQKITSDFDNSKRAKDEFL